MRIWDIPFHLLCTKHALAEHRELHAVWGYITTGNGGSYQKHPETLRWVGKLPALRTRHEEQVMDFKRRGWKHNSPLSRKGVRAYQDRFQFVKLISEKEQRELLRKKGCKCNV